MAGATLTTFESILKEFYLGPVIEEINNEVFVLELFEKATVDWNGRVAIVPVHVARNTGVNFAAESGALPDAGEQSYSRLQINAKFQYGRFQITGPAISAAQSGGKGSFIGYVDAEMKKLVNDVRNSGNQVSVNGNEVRGFLNQHLDVAATGGATSGPFLIAAAGTMKIATQVEYTGDFSAFSNSVGGIPTIPTQATPATWVPVRIVRCDTFQDIVAHNAAGDVATPGHWFVSAIDTAKSELSITFGGDIAATWQTDTVTVGFGLALLLRFAQDADTAGNPVGLNLSAAGALEEPSGMYSNIASPGTVLPGEVNANAYHQIVRSVGLGASATNVGEMRGIVLTQATAGTHARATLSLDRMQQALDMVYVDGVAVPESALNAGAALLTGGGTTPNGGGMEHDLIMMNPTMRQQYTTLLQGTLFTETAKASNGDAGFMQLSYSGIPIKTSRAVHRGALVFLRKETWCITELQSPGFADLDGNVLSRRANEDSYEGFYRWYYNIVCKQPNCNVVLCGVSVI